MAAIKVRLFGVFRMDTHLSEESIEAEKVIDVFDKLNVLAGEKFAEKKKADPSLAQPEPIAFKDAIVYINGERCPKKRRKLENGDEVWLLSPASGG